RLMRAVPSHALVPAERGYGARSMAARICLRIDRSNASRCRGGVRPFRRHQRSPASSAKCSTKLAEQVPRDLTRRFRKVLALSLGDITECAVLFLRLLRSLARWPKAPAPRRA